VFLPLQSDAEFSVLMFSILVFLEVLELSILDKVSNIRLWHNGGGSDAWFSYKEHVVRVQFATDERLSPSLAYTGVITLTV